MQRTCNASMIIVAAWSQVLNDVDGSWHYRANMRLDTAE